MLTLTLSATVATQASTETTSTDESFIHFAARVRSEVVDLPDSNGHAVTLKLRVNGQYALSQKLHFFGQIDHVEAFLENKHSDGVLLGSRPVIADPEGTEINQFNIRASLDNTTFTLGRQSMFFGEERFIGSVSFRQNDQTYDGVRIHHQGLSGVSLNYAYVNQVNRIFGDDANTLLSPKDIRFEALNGFRPLGQLGDHEMDAHFLHAEYRDWDYIDIASFAYLVDNTDAPALSNDTYGLTMDTLYKEGHIKWLGSLTVAEQENTSGNWLSFYQWEIGAQYKQFRLKVRKEYFGSHNNHAFQTPLATLHKFQGWADQFLSTPAQGLVDESVQLLWRKRPWILDFRYHLFDSGKQKIGSEFDLDFIFEPNRDHEFKLRFATFKAQGNQTLRPNDVMKLALMYSYRL